MSERKLPKRLRNFLEKLTGKEISPKKRRLGRPGQLGDIGLAAIRRSAEKRFAPPGGGA